MNGVREAFDEVIGPSIPPEQLHRVEVVARRFDVGRTTIYALIRSGQLRSLKVNGARRVPESAVGEYLARQAG